jgi:ATP-dependent Clp protease, protease subunit
MDDMIDTGMCKEFREYALKHMGISSMQLYYWDKIQDTLYGASTVPMITDSMTPMILEERELRVTQMSVFDRLMMDRIIWLAGPVNDRMSTIVTAQLMFLDNVDEKDITFHVDSPGGSVKSGLSMVDMMNYIHSDIITINTGMAASMGSILLGAGTKGKRFSLPNSRVMLHQVSAGASGNIQDMEISMAETKKYNKGLFELLGSYCGKTAEQVLEDTKRDLWLTSDDALSYGIIDGVISTKKKAKK